jgi:hypothetical protein
MNKITITILVVLAIIVVIAAVAFGVHHMMTGQM